MKTKRFPNRFDEKNRFFDRERSRRGPKNAKVVVVVGVINFCSTGKNVLLMKSLKYYEILKNIMKSYEIY